MIAEALKHDLKTRFEAVVWDDDGGFRIVFEMVKGDGVREDRAVRYVDVVVAHDCVVLFAQNRHSTRVNYHDPASIDVIDQFIKENCLESKPRRLGQRRLR